jgi:hypothetical protein
VVGKPQGGRQEALTATQRQQRWRAKKRRLAKHARLGNGRDRLNAHPEGFHPTPPRAVRALLTVETFEGKVWECACGDGAVSRVLEAHGLTVISTDIVFAVTAVVDMTSSPTTPRSPATSSPIPISSSPGSSSSTHLHRISEGGTVCMLLPVRWEAAQSRRHLMAQCCRKWVLSRRPEMHRGGHTGKHSPQIDCAWYVFCRGHTGGTLTIVLPPECGEVPPLAPDGL